MLDDSFFAEVDNPEDYMKNHLKRNMDKDMDNPFGGGLLGIIAITIEELYQITDELIKINNLLK
ncbi:hypothetical protein SAMN06265827_12822 [Orenia metallireducens]|uniref:Uncharacterized protein n=1 Tax=Orenia metallireducens TaxID=1413210 RepID=A0A285HZU7_9FIRM|nr:hypothetical protein [Orenia metallireducens]SNY41234.1 hypothetical protein SAMN06265827_12822 [Orenia metallireducens]